MARKLRIQYPGAIYHVTARGNGRQKVFLDRRDRERFLERLADSVETYGVRIYLFCLMTNHIHMVLETPQANLSRFMQSLITGYTVYFNVKHRRNGHLFQGRYGAKLVEGDEYLLSLSRYVHLNPVHVRSAASLSLNEKVKLLRDYKWSSYASYIGKLKALNFVDYEPVLAEMHGRKGQRPKRYRAYVESGIAETDVEFVQLLKNARHGIGSDEFCKKLDDLYHDQVTRRTVVEDVSFRRMVEPLESSLIFKAVGQVMGLAAEDIRRRRRNAADRPIAAHMLCKYGGLTQREVAELMNTKTGTGVSYQIQKYKELVKSREYAERISAIEQLLHKAQGR